MVFLGTVITIFASRYLPILRLAFKVLYTVLGATALAEGVGKLVLSQGLASSIRPRKYFTIDRDFLENSLEDVEQLMNFFVIEFQRILFAENLMHTATVSSYLHSLLCLCLHICTVSLRLFKAFIATLLAYWLIKFTPLWGITLMADCTVFLAPLIYITNREVIDEQLGNAGQLINDQTTQLRDLANHHTAQATETIKGYAGDYTTKAQEMISNAAGGRGGMGNGSMKKESSPAYKSTDFPNAPTQPPAAEGGATPIKSEPVAA